MTSSADPMGHLSTLRRAALWVLLVIPIGLISGSASALFLWLLDVCTQTRIAHGWLLYLLPLAGVLIAVLYQRAGKSADRGTHLLLEQIHEPGGGVPARMAPLVLLTTLITHLFGGSAGREGTAVQMGGSLADGYRRLFRIPVEHQRILLMAGIAAGFGSVFGTPVAGAIFSMEVLRRTRHFRYDTALAVFVASIVGDLTCSAWGAHHTQYQIGIGGGSLPGLPMVGWVIAAAIAFGLAARLFFELTHALQKFWQRTLPHPLLRPVAGALVIILLVHLLGTRDYLGLGVQTPPGGSVSILSCFQAGGATPLSWWWKLLFTAITLSCGFKGGEVTPLFFIGAALGHTIGSALGMPVDLFAGLGFIAVFAGASKTPIACTLMGMELFGGEHAVSFAVACAVAYFVSGRWGIYHPRVVAG